MTSTRTTIEVEKLPINQKLNRTRFQVEKKNTQNPTHYSNNLAKLNINNKLFFMN